MKNVENKVIIITGASFGIGVETAKVLAKKEWRESSLKRKMQG